MATKAKYPWGNVFPEELTQAQYPTVPGDVLYAINLLVQRARLECERDHAAHIDRLTAEVKTLRGQVERLIATEPGTSSVVRSYLRIGTSQTEPVAEPTPVPKWVAINHDVGDDQVSGYPSRGCRDPRTVLIPGRAYSVDKWDEHSFHTDVTLAGVEGVFNSVCLHEVPAPAEATEALPCPVCNSASFVEEVPHCNECSAVARRAYCTGEGCGIGGILVGVWNRLPREAAIRTAERQRVLDEVNREFAAWRASTSTHRTFTERLAALREAWTTPKK